MHGIREKYPNLYNSFRALHFEDLTLSPRTVIESQIHNFVISRKFDIVENYEGTVDLQRQISESNTWSYGVHTPEMVL